MSIKNFVATCDGCGRQKPAQRYTVKHWADSDEIAEYQEYPAGWLMCARIQVVDGLDLEAEDRGTRQVNTYCSDACVAQYAAAQIRMPA